MKWSDDLSLYQRYLLPRIRRGQGRGEGTGYKPWHGLREGPRRGTSGVPIGVKTQRPHDLQSTTHHCYFYLLERLPDIVDIRERFPILHIDETLTLCSKYGLEHPSREFFPEPLLLDFVNTRTVGGKKVYEARCLPPANYQPDGDQPTLLHVKRDWCRRHGIGWKLVDTDKLTVEIREALKYARGWVLHRYEPSEALVDRFARAFARAYKRPLTLTEVLELCSAATGESYDRCDDHFRYAVWTGKIKVDLRQPLGPDQLVVLDGEP